MTKWFGYFKDGKKVIHFRLISAADLTTAEVMANELAVRNKSECVGVIIAPDSFQSAAERLI